MRTAPGDLRAIRFVDLSVAPEVGEAIRAGIERVAGAGSFILGEEVTAFERELAAACGAAHVVGVGSGSDALLLALAAVGVQPGDAVVTTPLSFIATAEAIARLGAKPVFVDLEEGSLCLSAGAVAAFLATCRPTARGLLAPGGARVASLLVVHLYGRVAPGLMALHELARSHDLPLVQDAAQAVAARAPGGVPLSRYGPVCCSFFPTKNLGAWGDGGAVLTGDEAVRESCLRMRRHGWDPACGAFTELGLNSRLDALQAVVLRAKLPALPLATERRRGHAAHYARGLTGLRGLAPPPPLAEGDVAHLVTVEVDPAHRASLMAHLAAQRIESKVYYPTLLCDEPALASRSEQRGSLPNARRSAERVLSLPAHPELQEDDVERVIRVVAGFMQRERPGSNISHQPSAVRSAAPDK